MVVWIKTGRVLGIHCWLSVWTETGNDSSANTAYIFEEAYEDRLLLCDRWQTSAQACTSY